MFRGRNDRKTECNEGRRSEVGGRGRSRVTGYLLYYLCDLCAFSGQTEFSLRYYASHVELVLMDFGYYIFGILVSSILKGVTCEFP